MGELRVRINEQTYALACGDGEEERVRALAKYLDDHVKRLAEQIGRTAESRLLMLAALTICDELFTAREELSQSAAGRDEAEWARAADLAERLAQTVEARTKDAKSMT